MQSADALLSVLAASEFAAACPLFADVCTLSTQPAWSDLSALPKTGSAAVSLRMEVAYTRRLALLVAALARPVVLELQTGCSALPALAALLQVLQTSSSAAGVAGVVAQVVLLHVIAVVVVSIVHGGIRYLGTHTYPTTCPTKGVDRCGAKPCGGRCGDGPDQRMPRRHFSGRKARRV
jgi:hypothetical protein